MFVYYDSHTITGNEKVNYIGIFQQTKDSIAHKAVISEGTQLASILFYNKG